MPGNTCRRGGRSEWARQSAWKAVLADGWQAESQPGAVALHTRSPASQMHLPSPTSLWRMLTGQENGFGCCLLRSHFLLQACTRCMASAGITAHTYNHIVKITCRADRAAGAEAGAAHTTDPRCPGSNSRGAHSSNGRQLTQSLVVLPGVARGGGRAGCGRRAVGCSSRAGSRISRPPERLLVRLLAACRALRVGWLESGSQR